MIYAIIMAGGLGTRLSSPIEKPIFKFLDKPLIEYVINNLKKSKLVDDIYIATSPNTPETVKYLSSFDDINIINTSGENYLVDLSFVLEYFSKNSFNDVLLFINADLPFIDFEIIDNVLNFYIKNGKDALSIYVPIEIYEDLGLKYNYDFNGSVPSGLNVLRSENIIQEEEKLIISIPQLAFNINTLDDVDIATDFYKILKKSNSLYNMKFK